MKKRRLFYLDISLLVYVILLSVLGIVFAYSSNIQVESSSFAYQYSYIKQTIFFISGLTLMWIVSIINYKKIAEYAPLIYILCVLILMYTLFFGKVVNNSKRWIGLNLFSLQPSEFVKVAMIIVVASYLHKHRQEMKQFKTILKLLLLCLLPTVLILLQPDLGTAMVYVLMIMVMLFIGNINIKYFSGLLIIGLLSIGIPLIHTYAEMMQHTNPLFKEGISDQYQWFLIGFFVLSTAILFVVSVWMRNIALQNMTFFSFCVSCGLICSLFVQNVLLKQYQRERLLVFFNPYISKWDTGYNIIQSQITIGSGGLFGKGIFNGTQGQLGFLPSRNTDFIFSVIGEEFGFLGTCGVIVLFYLFILRLLKAAKKSKDYLGSLMVIGITSMFSIQVFINIGMTIGVAPVTGLPLPFLTYGGSTMWTSLIAIGLVFNVQLNRYVHRSHMHQHSHVKK